MKKKIILTVVIAVILVSAIALTGCGLFNFGNAYEKLTKNLTKKGTLDEESGTYVVSQYDAKSNTTFKMIAYTKEGEEKICLQFISKLGILNLNITEEVENYKWVFTDEDFGNITGHINLKYNYDSVLFVVCEDFGDVTEDYEITITEAVELSIRLCLLDFELYLLDNFSSLSAIDFGISVDVPDWELDVKY